MKKILFLTIAAFIGIGSLSAQTNVSKLAKAKSVAKEAVSTTKSDAETNATELSDEATVKFTKGVNVAGDSLKSAKKSFKAAKKAGTEKADSLNTLGKEKRAKAEVGVEKADSVKKAYKNKIKAATSK